MDSASNVTSTMSTLSLAENVEVPSEKFSILTAMMDTVPDIFVDSVLSDLEFRDIFTFKNVSHRCEDLVLANINRLKKPEKIAVRIQWADNTKSLTFGHQEGTIIRESEDNTFVVVASIDDQMNVDPANSWREGSVLFMKKETTLFGLMTKAFTEVCSINGEDADVVPFLLKKFLPRMLVNGICAKQLEKSDFVMLSETHGVIGNMHITINEGSNEDFNGGLFGIIANVQLGAPAFRSIHRSLRLEDIVAFLGDERLASLSVADVQGGFAIPKSFFQSSSLKNIVKISLGSYPNGLATEFDDELLLETLPQLTELQIGESNMTAAGLNTLLKQHLAGMRSFISVELTLRRLDESITKDALWAELVDGIPWPDYREMFHSENKERGLGMRFLDDECARSVKFFSEQSFTYFATYRADDDEDDESYDEMADLADLYGVPYNV